MSEIDGNDNDEGTEPAGVILNRYPAEYPPSLRLDIKELKLLFPMLDVVLNELTELYRLRKSAKENDQKAIAIGVRILSIEFTLNWLGLPQVIQEAKSRLQRNPNPVRFFRNDEGDSQNSRLQQDRFVAAGKLGSDQTQEQLRGRRFTATGEPPAAA